MSIEEYFGDWSKVVDLNEADKIIRKLADSGKVICPQLHNVFRAFRLCPLSNLRCLVLGQDPYPNNKATGIAFANTTDTPQEYYSPSLEVIRESVINYTIPHNKIIFDPSLEKWEAQGVLMLNSALSCEIGRVGSHYLLWKPFITSLLTNLSEYMTGVVYVLMGNQAQGFEPCINKQFNHVIRIRHPSYYARTKTKMPSEVWKQINDILIGQNGKAIEWYKEELLTD